MQQDRGMAESTVEASEQIAADPQTVYDLIADLPRMGQWSPENTGGKWLSGATGPAVGARFRGTNRAGFRRWSTTCEVTAAEPGKRFAFHVSVGPMHVSDWVYDFTSDGGGTRVTERWTDRRAGWMRRVAGPVTGVPDRATHNLDGMRKTLAALKRAAEQPSATAAE
jgi:uncharacterized protein YndB with AHSA1/START domain